MIGLVAIVALAIWKTGGGGAPVRVMLPRRIDSVMGTDGVLVAVIRPAEHADADDSLREAENVLRNVEAQMSVWLKRSELSRLNRAAAGVEVRLSAASREVLHAARQAYADTDGAFDVTCRPRIELWRWAARDGAAPTDAELAAARSASSWEQIRLTQNGAVKQEAGVQVDLGGLAKGFAIDRAVELLRARGWPGGLVNLGGDIRCFGAAPTGQPWNIDVQCPFGNEPLGTLALTDAAVCTSGNYHRHFEVDGRRLSHIVDPRTGRPAEAACSATVVAADALTADIWATALSVLGPEGLDRLPEGVDALLVVGTEPSHRLIMTGGFWQRFRGRR